MCPHASLQHFCLKLRDECPGSTCWAFAYHESSIVYIYIYVCMYVCFYSFLFATWGMLRSERPCKGTLADGWIFVNLTLANQYLLLYIVSSCSSIPHRIQIPTLGDFQSTDRSNVSTLRNHPPKKRKAIVRTDVKQPQYHDQATTSESFWPQHPSIFWYQLVRGEYEL